MKIFATLEFIPVEGWLTVAFSNREYNTLLVQVKNFVI
jgi:hypothetical protein